MATDVCKHTLATLNNALFTVDSLFEGVDFHNNVSRYVSEVYPLNIIVFDLLEYLWKSNYHIQPLKHVY